MAGHPPTQLQKEDADGSIIASPLHVAAALDTVEQFEGHAGSMLNGRDSNGMTPLMVAAQRKSRHYSCSMPLLSTNLVTNLVK